MPAKKRPFRNSSIDELEKEFALQAETLSFLEDLQHELTHRRTKRARALRHRVNEALEAFTPSRGSPPITNSPQNPSVLQAPQSRRVAPDPQSPAPSERTDVSRSTPSFEPIEPLIPRLSATASFEPGSPEAILDTWTALEVLSPQSFRNPEDLAGGERTRIARFTANSELPWQRGEKSRPNRKLFYHVVLGAIDLRVAIEKLVRRYSDLREERPAAAGHAIVASLVLNQQGQLAGLSPLAISSFAWGLPYALRGNLGALSRWSEVEEPMVESLLRFLSEARSTDDETPQSLDAETLWTAFNRLLRGLELPEEMVLQPSFAIRCYEYFKNPEPPEPLLLNSFFLEDLSRARSLFERGAPPVSLVRYLGIIQPKERVNVLQDLDRLEKAVAPQDTPPARWPGRGRHSLVLLQQAAVNLGLKQLAEGGIFGINGPPGTGKTTLLRDFAAAIVTKRAEALTGFGDPAQAFQHSGEKIGAGKGWLHLYRLASEIRGHEMLVASSNNSAVENVSAALPGVEAVADDAPDLAYYRTLSDELLEQETWGLVAAVLGNAANRARFQKTFWWDQDVGMRALLSHALGQAPLVDVRDSATGEVSQRLPRVVTEDNIAASPEEARERWRNAREDFLNKLQRSRELLARLDELRRLAAALPDLRDTEKEACTELKNRRIEEEQAGQELRRALIEEESARGKVEGCRQRLSDAQREAPMLLLRWLPTSRVRSWRLRASEARSALRAAEMSHRAAEAELTLAESRLETVRANRQGAEEEVRRARQRLEKAEQAVAEGLNAHSLDTNFWREDHTSRQLRTPWLSRLEQRTRDEVFISAMKLHKAFVEAAAQPLRHNLGALMMVMGGRRFSKSAQQELLPDLWASLFLVVPLVSTTFASIGAMLRDLPPASLGWLFIDEAGQALPQAAVGAVLRARRAVVVGDPLQIEPIVPLPPALTVGICDHFGVDADRFNAPAASAQTLADQATPFMTSMESSSGLREVGVPLLVHRRCTDPMFSISNAVAYDSLRVQAKKAGPSPIGEALGRSRWIHVAGSGVDKWSPEEGQVVLRLLEQLAQAGVRPDLYVISPFVIVARHLRKEISQAPALQSWLEDPTKWSRERIGTVHTAQGREAEAVLFVLGAPDPQQTGSRLWAGSQPNLLNVAVTRAKERLYVIGNRDLWKAAGLFRELDRRLE